MENGPKHQQTFMRTSIDCNLYDFAVTDQVSQVTALT